VFALDIFEIRDRDIDVEEIKQKIRENIGKRKECDISIAENIEKFNMDLQYKFDQDYSDIPDFIKKNTELEYLNLNWNIQNKDYFIQSNRPHIGWVLKRGRGLVHDEVRRYIDPVIWSQSEFNLKNAKLSNMIAQKIAELANLILAAKMEVSLDVDEKISASTANILSDVQDMLSLVKAENSKEIEEKINIFINANISSIIKENFKSNISDLDEELRYKALISEIFYNSRYSCTDGPKSNDNFNFSNRSKSDGMNRIGKSVAADLFADWIRCFKGCKNVAYIGFELSNFSEIIEKQHQDGDGIEDILAECKKIGFVAIKTDPLSYIESVENKSIDGIFISQIADDMSVDYLFNLIKLSYEKLPYDSYILIYNPNKLSILADWNPFNPDPLHKCSVSPEILKFLLKLCGFRDIEERNYRPASENTKLKAMKTQDPQENLIADLIKNYNSNISYLNKELFGFKDCAVIAKR
jgi:O-antigen chain-terminating methyltransferase